MTHAAATRAEVFFTLSKSTDRGLSFGSARNPRESSSLRFRRDARQRAQNQKTAPRRGHSSGKSGIVRVGSRFDLARPATFTLAVPRVATAGSPRWRTVTASTGGLDDEDVAGRKFGAVGASHHMAADVAVLDPLSAEGSIQPTGEPERSYVAAG
jgi:hypothetical protein